jgi:REP element-mobilizing transposase RayT
LGRLVVDALRWHDNANNTRTLAFVVMPDHLHWLFELTGTETLSRVMSSVKKRSARGINAADGVEGSLWQPGFHDHAVRQEEDLESLASYVVQNPVRARLVASVREYPLWDAMWL